MTMQHLVKEKTMESICVYCGNNLVKGKWISEFDIKRHYKSTTCNCGCKNWVRVDFIGSGETFDGWIPNGELVKDSLETKV